jgi:hypothetical protein
LQQHIGAADLFLDPEPLGWPVLGRHVGQQQIGQLLDAVFRPGG